MHNARKTLVLGGLVASLVLLAFGIATIWMGINGRAEVRDSLAREKIVGTDDSPIAGQKVDTGAEARTFAATIRKHTLAGTDGRTYSQMGRFLTESGEETDDPAKAAIDPVTDSPMPNRARDIWVTSTALSTALNTSYFAEQVSMFSIMVGIALLLTGVGFSVLTLGALRIPGDNLIPRPARRSAPEKMPVA